MIWLIDEVYCIFGFEYLVEFLICLEDLLGDDSFWEVLECVLVYVFEEFNLFYEVNKGDGVFYGLKIDFYIKDVLK